MSSNTVALVPLRAPGVGKTRLADALSPERRAALAGAMLADVCDALAVAAVDALVVVAGGEAAAAAACALGLEVVLDPPGCDGLDAALWAAQQRVGPVGALLVVTADLPRLAADDVTAVLDTDAEVVVAPTDDGGTGGLLRRPGDVMPTAYGPRSARRHRIEAAARGLRVATCHRPGFATDVDTLGDLASLRTGPLGRATTAVLERWTYQDAETG
ncbi:2-phospho-L-lactate guanylyltransferase [Egicoccus sp. AB-alg6-2]|uniref:2-phospho-L-lactate guanylyltransferase n=1 Tax=Egicoccus sp. AB-alg6-2 TaxID=3242692 RepID=UPI00359EF8CE